ncbi:MAG: 30S ribosomal protein S12 methylthiotransferase RimO [Candidatus Omnitrophica bacterium]|nr:30S ribosomal protein S12 methylthiotransferase RimO [Candidatus Omnitrophota bacterium]
MSKKNRNSNSTVGIISLGCPRNQLDSEVIAGSLKKAGFSIVDMTGGADICVINTCAFIKSAREESVDSILEAAELKKGGKIGYLVVCGCLPQLYKEKLASELSEADLMIGTSDFPELPRLLKNIRKPGARSVVSAVPDYLYDERSPRISFTPPHYAYLKISEGCSNFCSYCIISRLRGVFRSRSIESVTKETKSLSRSGRLKEINLIGQDTTLFGVDRYGRMMLGELLRRLCGIETSVEWFRILYTHPAHYTDELISVIRREKKICKYLDLPIQHISDRILKKMNRCVTKRDIITLIEKLRRKIPGLVLRTSVITGFPGETDKDFNELVKFLRDTRFERLGAFVYSREEGTPAARFEKQVPEKVKRQRLDAIMEEQKRISLGINKRYLGRTLGVLIDEKCEGEKEKFLGRTGGDAPEVDGIVYVTGKGIRVGQICDVRIKDTLEYDLVGNKI